MGIYLFAASMVLFLFGIMAIIFWARDYPIIHTGDYLLIYFCRFTARNLGNGFPLLFNHTL